MSTPRRTRTRRHRPPRPGEPGGRVRRGRIATVDHIVRGVTDRLPRDRDRVRRPSRHVNRGCHGSRRLTRGGRVRELVADRVLVRAAGSDPPVALCVVRSSSIIGGSTRCPISAWRGFRGVEDLEQSQDVRGCCVTATELLVASVDQRAVVASRALPFAGEVTIDSARIVERERKAVVSMPTERRNRVLPTEVPNDLCFRLLIEPEREPRNLPGAPVRVVVLRQNARQNFPEVPLQGDCVQHAQVHQPRTGARAAFRVERFQ